MTTYDFLPTVVVTSAGCGLYALRSPDGPVDEGHARAALSQIGTVLDLVKDGDVYVGVLRDGLPTTAMEMRAASDLFGSFRRAAAASELVSRRLQMARQEFPEIDNAPERTD